MELTKKPSVERKRRMKTTWQWTSSSGYAGGAPPAKPQAHGMISVEDDGSIQVSPDDDYYGGELSPAEALELAVAILAKHQALRAGAENEPR